MSRDGAGVYTLPAGSIVTDGATAEISQHNTPLQDIATDLNTARPVVAGGTGATTASGARTNLGLGSAAVLDWTPATSFTPAIADNTSGGNEASIGTNTSKYLKHGPLVFVNMRLENIDTTGMTASNSLYLTGLPFASTTGSAHTELPRTRFISFTNQPFAFLTAGVSYLQFLENRTGADNAAVLVSALTSGTACLYLDFNYSTAS